MKKLLLSLLILIGASSFTVKQSRTDSVKINQEIMLDTLITKIDTFVIDTIKTNDVIEEINLSNYKTGVASYYHDKFHGRKTASGKIYNKNEMTCAHKTLPFGTKLHVVNAHNNKDVIVTVTDRGPFIKGRVLDLSRAAAKELGFIGKGFQKVKYKKITKENNEFESHVITV